MIDFDPIRHCPHCGRPFVVGYFDHVEECARRRQAELDRDWEEKHPPGEAERIGRVYRRFRRR
jgi:hypothetical protein